MNAEDLLIRQLPEIFPANAAAVRDLQIAVDDGEDAAEVASAGRKTIAALLDLVYALRGALTAANLTINTARLAGRTTAGNGAVEEISIGAGLSLAAGSLSAQVTANRTIQYFPEIEGLTGGTASDLDSLVTTSRALKEIVQIVIANEAQRWILVSGTAAEAAAFTSVVPIDHASTTNEKYWLRIE